MAKIKDNLAYDNEEPEESRTKTETGTAVTVAAPKLPAADSGGSIAPPRDPFDEFADDADPQHLIGRMLKFAKGDYTAGRDGDAVPLGTQFTANMDLLMAGFDKWEGGRRRPPALVRVGLGLPLPRRANLGDHDQDLWEIGIDGKPRDPWQAVNYLPLMDSDGELYTFVASGVSAIREVGALSRAYARHRRTRPLEYPVVALAVGSYQHRDRSIGKVKHPRLDIVGWTHKAPFMKALAAAGLVADEAVPAVPDKPTTALPPATVLTHPRSGQRRDDSEPPPINEIPEARKPDDDDDF